MKFEIAVDVECPVVSEDAICFETGASKAQLEGNLPLYEHHGLGNIKGALTSFYEDLLQGRPLPVKFITRAIQGVDTLLAIALFMHRELLVQPNTMSFVATVDLVHRYPNMYGHTSPDISQFLRYFDEYLVRPKLSKTEMGERLTQSIQWIRDYLLADQLPHLGNRKTAQVRVVDFGTNGFVLAEVKGGLEDGWEQLYRMGYLRGVAFSPDVKGRRHVMASRKSVLNELDTKRASMLLNELEYSFGELPEWTFDELTVRSPPDGTVCLLTQMVEVFVRV